jgi:hypothetical protein
VIHVRFVDRDMVMRYLGLGVGHKNAPTFPCEEGLIPERVLIENDEEPWPDPDHAPTVKLRLPANSDDTDNDDDMDDGRLSPIGEDEPDSDGYEW